MTDRPARVHDLVGWIERVHVESELAKQKMRTAVEQLTAIVESKFQGTAVEAYARFVTALEGSETQAQKVKDAVTPMKASAEPLFEQWAKDLEQYASPAMRTRSQTRLTHTRERYNDLAVAVDPAIASYDVLNRSLRDHALFLGNDFNAESVRMIREDVLDLGKMARELDGRFDLCLHAAQEYVNNYALPVGAEPGADPGAEPNPAPGPGGAVRPVDRQEAPPANTSKESDERSGENGGKQDR